MIKLFAFDLDGTLLTENQEIDAETLQSIKSQKDIKYVIATGRNYSLVEDIVKKYELDCDLILNNGHEFLSSDKSIHFTYAFSYEKIRKICEILLKYKFHISLQGGDGNKYIFQDREEYYTQHIDMSSKVRNRDMSELLQSPLFSREFYLKNTITLTDLAQLEGLSILKVDAKQLDKHVTTEAIAELNEIPGLDLSTSFESYIEVCDSVTDKGQLLLQVARMYGINADEIAVFGDSDNDIQLIKAVPHSFAMGNGKDELKVHAAHITDTNDNQGVLKGIRKILEEQNNVII